MAIEIGFVYVLRNECMNGTYKIGMTDRSPNQRARELSKATGVPSPYEVVFYAEVEAPRKAEAWLHEHFKAFRINASREYFRCPLGEILNAIINDLDAIACYESDIAIEAMNPGRVFPHKPLYFESTLHDQGYLLRLRKENAA